MGLCIYYYDVLRSLNNWFRVNQGIYTKGRGERVIRPLNYWFRVNQGIYPKGRGRGFEYITMR